MRSVGFARGDELVAVVGREVRVLRPCLIAAACRRAELRGSVLVVLEESSKARGRAQSEVRGWRACFWEFWLPY